MFDFRAHFHLHLACLHVSAREMERLAKTEHFDHLRRVGSAHWHTHCFSSHFSATVPSIAMGARVSCQRRRCEAKVNATVVANIFTLEVAVEDVNTDGEKKGSDDCSRDAT